MYSRDIAGSKSRPIHSQIAASEPLYPAGVGMFGSTIHQQRFKRGEEITCRWATVLLALSIGTEFGAQQFNDRRRTGNFGAALFEALELGQEIAARCRRQSPEILQELFRLCHCSAICRLTNN
jgi:hypothetical protein